MTISQEAVSRYDFWLSFIWHEFWLGLVCLAGIQAILMWSIRRAKSVLSLLFAVASVPTAWLLCATGLWLVCNVPNATLVKFGVQPWMLAGIPAATVVSAFVLTTVAYVKLTRARLAV